VRLPTLLQYLACGLATLALAPSAMALALAGLHRTTYAMVRAWAWAVLMVSGVRFRVFGLDNLPDAGSCVVISNHCSHLDGPVLARALPLPVYFIIKQELTRVPLWGWALVRIGFIAVDRDNSERAHQQMDEAVGSVHAGRSVLVFAEGTRSTCDSLLPFKKGGFHLAVAAQAPILPVAINHSRRLMPKGAPSPRPGVVDVHIGQPVPTLGMGRDDVDLLLERTRAAITEMRRLDPDFVG